MKDSANVTSKHLLDNYKWKDMAHAHIATEAKIFEN